VSSSSSSSLLSGTGLKKEPACADNFVVDDFEGVQGSLSIECGSCSGATIGRQYDVDDEAGIQAMVGASSSNAVSDDAMMEALAVVVDDDFIMPTDDGDADDDG